jgi:hypothetical protein
MDNSIYTIQTPLSYQDWVDTKDYNSDISQDAYLAYLISWYKRNSRAVKIDQNTQAKKDQYIQLVKDLLYLFNDQEKKDLFLTDIDFNNNEDLIYIIPYLANKLKQISQLIAEKREELKKVKLKDQFIGSTEGLEKILYEYILKNFTTKPYAWTRIPLSPLVNQFPQLSSISGDFYVEIEELYDTNSYHDSDPSVPISEYINIDELVSLAPFDKLTNDELASIVTSRLLLRVADTPLSQVFNQYLTVSPQLSTTGLLPLSAKYTTSIYNQIAANQKYLGESVYGLTAIRTNQDNIADLSLSLPFEQGNNWFYWPSGDKGPDPSTLGNIFTPIPINNSNLILNRTVTGSDYMNSDLLFAYRDGILEGAWLQGYREQTSYDTMHVKLNSKDRTEFIFPWAGFKINSKDLSFKGYSLDDSSLITYQKLSPEIKANILSNYYNSTLPNSASYDMYLNQTSLVNAGANPAYFSDEADTIYLTPSARSLLVWSDALVGNVESAYLYKFDKTDIYVGHNVTDIHWPIQSFTGGVDNITLTLSANTCLPITLGSINPSETVVGAVAGLDFNTSDVIYKLSDNGGNPIEAAWLGGGSINQLDQLKNAIQVYDVSAVNCAQYIDGPIQPALAMKMEAGMYNSFIWMDQDTPADEVFKYYEHSTTCAYGNSFPHDFYTDQEYQNPTPLNAGKKFPLKQYPCTCDAVKYSPIGHQGITPTDYNGMTDMLFADPQGLGADFSFSTWKDTRNFAPHNSPQFSFYKIDGNLDKEVGFGRGSWKNGDGTHMILKTGRRYTYYRSNLRINSNSISKAPYLLIKYPYKNISITCGDNGNVVDLVIIIDNSRTQTFDLSLVKSIAKRFVEVTSRSNVDILISVISFAENGLILNYLTTDLSSLLSSIESIKVPELYPYWLTNITDGLILANNVLNSNRPIGNDCNPSDLSHLCKNLNTQIINQSNIATITNCPRPDAQKQILIFSDGQETVDIGTAGPYAQILKSNGIKIMGVDIGFYALTDNLMEQMTTDNQYYNLQKYLLYSDLNINTFTENLATYVMGCFPVIPAWCKAIRDASGNWSALHVPSDMVLNAGDYLAYSHQSQCSYAGQTTITTFSVPSISFTINIKLDGWNYSTLTFSEDWKGDGYGARPFWGKTFSSSATALPLGGGGRKLDEYVVLHQPEVSNMILKNGSYIRYNNFGDKSLQWSEYLTFNVVLSDQMWNKLLISKADSNLASTLNTINMQDYIIYQTNEPSDIMLESYTTLNPTKFNFYLSPLNKPFQYTENLYYINRCDASFVTFLSGMAIEAAQPYMNLDNVHYPTVANIAFPSTFITESETGNYLLPNKLGVSYYRGKGYETKLDSGSISYLDATNTEYMFLDKDKYGSRNRGLTRNDQLTPITVKRIDNRWMWEPYSSGAYAGTIVETLNNQKFVPYLTNYEINPNNQIGVCLQRDDFQFWNPEYYDLWVDQKNYPLTFRNELILQSFLDKMDTLLTDVGVQSEWKSDIYGNNFGLFKEFGVETSRYILTEKGAVLSTEIGLRFEKELNKL